MEEFYKKIIKHMIRSGKRIKKRAGRIEDIGVTKKFLTVEDLKIERELKKIIKINNPKHEFYSEEENFNFVSAEDVWVGDPISGTATFINGLAHYGMAMAHVHKGKVVFAAIYDPTVDQMYTAYKGKGAFLNGQRLKISKNIPDKINVLFLLSRNWKDKRISDAMLRELIKFNFYRTNNCEAISWCHLARGIYDGIVCFSKDSFPDFAGSLIIKEAGGQFFNIKGETEVAPEDRIFFGGNAEVVSKLKFIFKKITKQ